MHESLKSVSPYVQIETWNNLKLCTFLNLTLSGMMSDDATVNKIYSGGKGQRRRWYANFITVLNF